MAPIPPFILEKFYYTALIFIIPAGVLIVSSLLFLKEKETEYQNRKFLRIAFGLLWFIDGLLQLQPLLGIAFIEETVSPGLIMGSYQPWLSSLINTTADAWNLNPMVYDSIAAAIQIFGGAIMLIGPRDLLYKAVLILSIPWSILIWIVAEGLGNSISPGASWIIGSPGSVLFYLMASALLLSSEGHDLRKAVRILMIAIFLVEFAWQVIPSNGYWDGVNLAMNTYLISVRPQFPDFSGFEASVVQALFANPILYNSLISASLAVAAVLWILWPGRISVTYTVAISILTWIFLMGFGGLFTGSSTDPNTQIPLACISISYVLRSGLKTGIAESKAISGIIKTQN
ncbi:MAG: hypothetical protein M1267_03545 [Candidatus Thermoplasmatota archaeon]|jgi:hypothetical protein|nr:hypothetical protein [Candidatus Thermoplasmatota archaeon]MCL5800716.1 hypothetical protein [Candidatus Thermoplasmatota archaeon]